MTSISKLKIRRIALVRTSKPAIGVRCNVHLWSMALMMLLEQFQTGRTARE